MRRRTDLLRLAAHLGAWLPLAMLLWDVAQDNLTANPIQDITTRTGKTALVLLLLSLACTPVNAALDYKPVLRLRRPLGLYAFGYALLHFLTFVGLDYGFNPALLREAILEKRFALAGLAAFVLLIPLALTSTRGAMRRLGLRWKGLHRLVYPAAAMVIVHYVWLVKSDVREPLAYGAVLAALLAARLPAVRRALQKPRFARRRAAVDGYRLRGAAPTSPSEAAHHRG
jgi:sulfoxide reductase heme-binding subunit YedZ